MCLLSYEILQNLINKYKYKYNLVENKKKDKNTQTLVINNDNYNSYNDNEYDMIDNFHNTDYLINITEL